MKNGIVALFILLCQLTCIIAKCQQTVKPVKEYNRNDFTPEDSLRLLQEYGQGKVLINDYALATLVALSHFPELKNVRIQFIMQPAYSLLRTSPKLKRILSRKTRMYKIVVSDSTMWKLMPIMLKQMDFNTQVGVIGHELSHAADFTRRSFTNLVGTGIGHISSKYIDRFEYMTDSICIAHGLGYQLLAWSRFVRKALGTNNYDGADNINKPMLHERYMNPETIMEKMKTSTIYEVRGTK
jgi:hypothetical protein